MACSSQPESGWSGLSEGNRAAIPCEQQFQRAPLRTARTAGPATLMQRTKATLIQDLRAAQLLLGPSKLEPTVRCLGIQVDDALEISEQTEI